MDLFCLFYSINTSIQFQQSNETDKITISKNFPDVAEELYCSLQGVYFPALGEIELPPCFVVWFQFGPVKRNYFSDNEKH